MIKSHQRFSDNWGSVAMVASDAIKQEFEENWIYLQKMRGEVNISRQLDRLTDTGAPDLVLLAALMLSFHLFVGLHFLLCRPLIR